MRLTPTQREEIREKCHFIDHRVQWAGDCYICGICNEVFITKSTLDQELAKRVNEIKNDIHRLHILRRKLEIDEILNLPALLTPSQE